MVGLDDAEAFARAKSADIAFCKSIVFRLKAVGVHDEQLLCAAFLCNVTTNFEEVFSRFGREVATTVASLSKDRSLPRQKQEEQYVKQLKEAPWDSILIKLCEISANLKFIKEAEISKNKRTKMLKQNVHYLNILKHRIAENKARTPGIERLLEGVNETLTSFRQKPIAF